MVRPQIAKQAREYKQNAGCRFLRFVIRHYSRCAAKTELCVTVISFEAARTFVYAVFTAYLTEIRISKSEIRNLSELAVDLGEAHRDC